MGQTLKKTLTMAACAILTISMCACTTKLPNEAQQETTQESTPAAQPASSDSLFEVTVTAGAERTLTPDIATITCTVATNAPEDKAARDAYHAPDEIVDTLVDQGAVQENIESTDDGTTTTIRAKDMGLRDAARAQREVEALGAHVTDITYNISDPSAIKAEAIGEAYNTAKTEADAVVKGLGESAADGGASQIARGDLIHLEEGDIETIAQNENEITVRANISATFEVVFADQG